MASSQATLFRDVHSGLHSTRVARSLRPTTRAGVSQAVRAARAAGARMAVAGTRHSAGGQQVLEGGWLLDLRSLDRVLGLDPEAGLLTVESGATWPRILDYLATTWSEDGSGWTIAQKQTGADEISIGGSLAANAHGRALVQPPLVADIERFVIVDAAGNERIVSRTENAAFFRLAIGGYGLLGPVVEVTLRLRERVKVQRIVSTESVEDAMQLLRDRGVTGDLYGEFSLSIDPESYTNYLRRGVLTTWRRVDFGTAVSDDRARWSPADWHRLRGLAHQDPWEASRALEDHVVRTDGMIEWADLAQMGSYRPGYHAELEAAGQARPGSEVFTEVFLPTANVAGYMSAARAILRSEVIPPVIRSTIRLVGADEVTLLPYARDPRAAILFELHVEDTPVGRDLAGATARQLMAEALERDGTFHLAHHRWARGSQMVEAYPAFEDFLRIKRTLDPDERFQSDWYRHWKRLLGA